MRKHIRGIDHAVVLVRDLDRARDTWQRLGFTLTPRGYHSLGSQNHCIMFGRDYIELMALPKPHPAFQYFSDFLARGEGVGALALATDDAIAAHAEITRAGIPAEAPLALSRPVESLGEARFTLVQLSPEQTPGFRSFICQHHTRDLVWRPEYQTHAVGATSIASVIVVAEDGAPYAVLFESAPLQVLAAAQVRARLPGVGLPARTPPIVAALRIQVEDRSRAVDALRRGGFSPLTMADGALAIPADQANGIALIFD